MAGTVRGQYTDHVYTLRELGTVQPLFQRLYSILHIHYHLSGQSVLEFTTIYSFNQCFFDISYSQYDFVSFPL